ncbi:ATP-grasp domain-containing protein [Bombilactobacillus thymidiniphilus]|uniref:ATP-grasp domain-containing protein n=1 Tax=Bombilactobacillus thymidiniphilus TaxID=2923363 RepID=A0ABY4PC88_9LACO|nr:ATP-grasp domain-containing protein [Bombilactobacillus thymidiniphilus]UQS83230.1 ATP-grasp domain-containing protein [Bombilactobacillus thymidiniphilus]
MNFLGPNSTVGIITGDKQPLRLAQKANEMGFKVVVLTQQLAMWKFVDCQVIVGDSQNRVDLQKLLDVSDVVLYGEGNVQLADLQTLTAASKLVQDTEILDLVQDAYLEKCFFNDNNINIPPFTTVVDQNDLQQTVQEIGFPCVLKPIQRSLNHSFHKIFTNQEEIDNYRLPMQTFILESLVDIEQELFVMVGKDQSKQIQLYPIIKVNQTDGLQTAFVNLKDNDVIAKEVQDIAQTIATAITYQGLLAVKLCVTKTGMLYVERIYPGTIFAADIYREVMNFSQEELLLRSVCQWPMPLGQPRISGCNLMVTHDNLDQIIKLVQEHPQWKVTFNNNYQQDVGSNHVGVLTITADSEQKLRRMVNATNLWKL